MKKKPKKAIVESDTEAENYKVPEYKTVISFNSKDQLNVTLSKCGLVMLNNLVKVRNLKLNVEILVFVDPFVEKIIIYLFVSHPLICCLSFSFPHLPLLLGIYRSCD